MAMRRKSKLGSAGIREYAMGQARLLESYGNLSSAVAAINFRFDAMQSEMRAGFARMESRFDRVMSVLDSVVGKQHDNDRSHIVFDSMLGEHRRTLASHDHRLTSLESRLPPSNP